MARSLLVVLSLLTAAPALAQSGYEYSINPPELSAEHTVDERFGRLDATRPDAYAERDDAAIGPTGRRHLGKIIGFVLMLVIGLGKSLSDDKA